MHASPRCNHIGHVSATDRALAMGDVGLTSLAALPAEALRDRLPELFAAIEAAGDAADAPLVASLALQKALQGEAGYAKLKEDATLTLAKAGLEHWSKEVRALTATQLTRLAHNAADVTLLKARGLLLKLVQLIGDESLQVKRLSPLSPSALRPSPSPLTVRLIVYSSVQVSQKATAFFVACAAAGAEALSAVLLDADTLEALRALGRGGGSVVHLRVLDLCASLAVAGAAQFKLVDDSNLLAPVVELWRTNDPLVQLNAVELFATLASAPAGLPWLEAAGVLSELAALLDTPHGDDPMLDLLRPATLSCLGSILTSGGPAASASLLLDLRLVHRVWPLLNGSPPEILLGALATLTAAAAHALGAAHILEEHAGSVRLLGSLLRAHDEHTRVGAMSLTAQLMQTHALRVQQPTASGGDGLASAMDVDTVPSVGIGDEAALRSLFEGCSPSASTSAADAIAAMGSSLSAEVRGGALRMLHGMASVQWGAEALCASEGVLELLLTMEPVHAVPAEELRMKHAVAAAIAAWPDTIDALGAGTAANIRAYVAAGPFKPQRPRAARVAAPLTL